MKSIFRQLFAGCTLMAAFSAYALPPIVYNGDNGDTLTLNRDFVRTQCGAVNTKGIMPEISGIACSRVTPGSGLPLDGE